MPTLLCSRFIYFIPLWFCAYFFILFCFSFGAISSKSHGLFLTLHSGTSLDRLGDHMWWWGVKSGLARCRAINCLIYCTKTPASVLYIFLFRGLHFKHLYQNSLSLKFCESHSFTSSNSMINYYSLNTHCCILCLKHICRKLYSVIWIYCFNLSNN